MVGGGETGRAAGRHQTGGARGIPRKLSLAGRKYGWNINLVTPPAQSPDLNINDLGLFPSLKSRVWKEYYRTLDALVEGAKSIYGQYEADTLELV